MVVIEVFVMNTAARQDLPPSPSAAPISEPKSIGYGHPEYNFVQGLMGLQAELHKSDTSHQVALARIEQKLDTLTEVVNSTKSKVDDLTKWKFMIVGGAIVAGALGGIVLTLFAKFGDKVSFNNDPPQVSQTAQVKPQPPAKPIQK